MNAACIEDATTFALIYNCESTHSISMMLKHSQIKNFNIIKHLSKNGVSVV